MAVLKRSNRKQQELVELQLEAQRREAALVREKAAIADSIAAANAFVWVSRTSSEEMQAQLGMLASALTRWQMELDDGEMARELRRWPGVVFGAAAAFHIEHKKAGGVARADGAFVLVQRGISALADLGRKWQRADESEREDLLRKLQEIRRELGVGITEGTGVSSSEYTD